MPSSQGNRRARQKPAAKTGAARGGGRKPAPKPRKGSLMPGGWGTRLAVLAIFAVALGSAYLFWFRDSSFVEIKDVQISGLKGAELANVEAALEEAAARMTTLNMKPELLEEAVEKFVTVRSINAEADFPGTLRITVKQRHPAVLAVVGGGPRIPVSADGLLMANASVGKKSKLPKLRLPRTPEGKRLEGDALARAKVLAAAPAPLAPLIDSSRFDKDYGVVVQLRGSIPVRFGPEDNAEKKWAAAAAVLADPRLTSLTYLDVRAPERPAVGGAVSPTPA